MKARNVQAFPLSAVVRSQPGRVSSAIPPNCYVEMTPSLFYTRALPTAIKPFQLRIRNARTTSRIPKTIAQAPIHQIKASVPAAGATNNRMPNATEAVPARTSSHSLVMILRSLTAATRSMTPVTIAQAAIRINKPSAVIPGMMKASNPARMPSNPPRIKLPTFG